MRPMGALACALAGILAGCATSADVAVLAPERQESFPVGVKTLSDCVFSALSAQERGYGFRRILSPGGAVTIEGQLAVADTQGRYVEFQVDFAGGGGQTTVTERVRKNVWGDPIHPEWLWDGIKQCASEAQ